MISVENLTKDYGHGRGVFDISFEIKKGEVFGFLGPNGAGKTTTIRQILGFITPNSGRIVVDGQTVQDFYYETNKKIGYLPGEINFPEGMSAGEYIKYMAELHNVQNLDKANELIKIFNLEHTNMPVKKMSKGMKQKIGIVCAFMGDPEIIILDEPTSGLDPLMQKKFVDLIKQEKEKGKTILMSSHMFSEIEKTCDRTAIIKNGRIVAEIELSDIKKSPQKTFEIKFVNKEDYKKFSENKNFKFIEINSSKNRVKVNINDKDINQLLQELNKFKIKYISEEKFTLEDYFMKFYEMETKENNDDI